MLLNPRPLIAIHILLFVSLLAASAVSGTVATFERIGPYGGDVRSLMMDSQKPSIVYSGTSSGKIFKSSDGGAS